MSTDTQNGGQSATGAIGAVREQAESLVQQGIETVNQNAAKIQDNVRSTAQSYVDQAKSAAAGELQGVAQFVRNAIPSDNAPPIVSQYANQAAESLDQFAQSLQNQDLQSIVAGVNDFARRQPALFLGATVAIGFVVARFLRTKAPQSQHRYGAPASSLYPPQDFQHGYGATSPGLSAGAAGGMSQGGRSSAHGGGAGSGSGRTTGGDLGTTGGGNPRGGEATGVNTSGGITGGSLGAAGGSGGGAGGGGATASGGGTAGPSGGGRSSTGSGSSGGSPKSGSSSGGGSTSSGGSADRSGSPVG